MPKIARRTFLQSLGGLALRGQSAGRPNIILILADDMGFSDLGCYGSEIDTPNLNGLAHRGVRFTQFYNNARCCPSRASILTGLYPHQAGVGLMTGRDWGTYGYHDELNRECVTIAEVLRGAGYSTLMTGKWHVANDSKQAFDDRHDWPLQRGFDHHFGTIAGAGSYYAPHFLVRDNEHIEAGRGDFYYTDALGDQAVRFISDYANQPKPFFLYSAFTAPHWPLHAHPDDIEKYGERYRKGWDVLRQERHERMIGMGIVDRKWPLSRRDPRVPAWKDAPDKECQARRMAVYAAQIDRLDRNIGRMLAKLRETGQEQNTLVMFLSDNGGCAEEAAPAWAGSPYVPKQTRDGRPMKVGNNPRVMPGPEDTYQSYGLPWANASNTPLRLYKHYIHEGGISTPLIAAGAGVSAKPGSLTNQAGHIIDLMPTCLTMGGAHYPSSFSGHRIQEVEGLSLAPIFEGRERAPHDALYWEHEGNRGVREGKIKLVMERTRPWGLHDLESDRTEQRDLSAAMPEQTRRLEALWQRWAERAHVLPKPKDMPENLR